jgi:pimeloyl-ACP methyl ester carboxylesterase
MGSSGFSMPKFEFDFSAGLDQFPRKVLLVGSTCSALGAVYQAKHHQPLFGEAEVVRVPNAGHRLHVEQFELVFAALDAYFDAPRP